MKITEDYVSLEVAKLLEEKGFDKSCCTGYTIKSNSDGTCELISVCTLQRACKWLREVYNKHCDIGYDIDLEWYFQIIGLKEIVEYDYPEPKYYHAKNEVGFKTYEEAVEAALKYTLENLI